MADYTVTALLASVKRRGMLPATAEALSDDDFLEFANDELQTYIVPLLLSTREEYLVTYADTTTVANQANYDLPTRAIGGKLRSVLLSDGSGAFYDVPRIEPERVDDYSLTGAPVSYYLRGNEVILVPTPTAALTLRLGYFRRPNRLVTAAECAVVATASATDVTTSAAVPATFVADAELDFVKATPGFDGLQEDVAITLVSTSTAFRIDENASSDIAAGDYVCLAGESPIPQIPVELHPLLAQRVVVRALEALGLQEKQAAAEATAERMRVAVTGLLTPRVEGSARKIVNRHAPGFRNTTRAGYRWR